MAERSLVQEHFHRLARPWHWLLDALFPQRCLGCGRWGSWCCPACLASLTYPRQLKCPECGQTTHLGEFCADCAPGRALTGLWAAQPYGNPLVRNMIKELKFHGLTQTIPVLSGLMVGLMRAFSLPPAWHSVPKERWYLVPVPLHQRRERERNFNQTKLLAGELAAATGLQMAEVLQRPHARTPQSEIKDEAKRLTNVAGAFALAPGARATGNAYLLVDDVYTSGATLEACAQVLKAAGAREVWGLTAAKG